MFRRIALLVVAVVSLETASSPAQDVVLGLKYGRGVHAYFAGDYLKAHEQLNMAIEGGSTDPRAYYFRGLAYLKLGRAPEARMDFRKGAEMESKDGNKFYNVAKSLERVQGKARVELEDYRVDARMAALAEAENVRKARYEAIEQDESRVVRQATEIKEAEPVEIKPAPAPNAVAAPVEADPFDTRTEQPAAEQAEEEPIAKKPAKSELKAEATPAAEAAPSGDDPFDSKPAVEEKPAAEEKKPSDKSSAKAGEKKGNILGAIGKAVKAGVKGKASVSGDAKSDTKKKAAPAKKAAEVEDVFGDKAASDEPIAEDEPAAMEKEKAPADKPAEENVSEEQPADGMSADDKAADEQPADGMSADEKAADEKAADDAAPATEESAEK